MLKIFGEGGNSAQTMFGSICNSTITKPNLENPSFVFPTPFTQVIELWLPADLSTPRGDTHVGYGPLSKIRL